MTTFTEITYKRRPRHASKGSKVPQKRKKQSRRDYLRLWGIPERLVANGWLPRYVSNIAKGVYWYHFSLHVRNRDVQIWGTCISCGRPITVEGSDAGHFIPAASCGRDLLFDERNVNAECSHCNAWDELHLLGYARNLDKRYGVGTADELLRRYYEYKAGESVRDWSKLQYEEKIKELQYALA